MTNEVIYFIRKHLMISAGLSVLASGILTGFMIEPTLFNFVILSLAIFGAFALAIIMLGLYFPKYVIPGYVEDCDPSEYVTVYFYDGYVNGFSKVTQLYGNPADIDGMEHTYSYINENGLYITDKWFLAAGDFVDGRAIVCDLDGNYNIIDTEGNYICAHGYPAMADEFTDGKVKVGDEEHGVNFVDIRTGKELWPRFKKELYAEIHIEN